MQRSVHKHRPSEPDVHTSTTKQIFVSGTSPSYRRSAWPASRRLHPPPYRPPGAPLLVLHNAYTMESRRRDSVTGRPRNVEHVLIVSVCCTSRSASEKSIVGIVNSVTFCADQPTHQRWLRSTHHTGIVHCPLPESAHTDSSLYMAGVVSVNGSACWRTYRVKREQKSTVSDREIIVVCSPSQTCLAVVNDDKGTVDETHFGPGARLTHHRIARIGSVTNMSLA